MLTKVSACILPQGCSLPNLELEYRNIKVFYCSIMIWLLQFCIILSLEYLNNVDRQKIWEVETHFYLSNHVPNPWMPLALPWGKFKTHTSEGREFAEVKSAILSYRFIILSKAIPSGWNSITIKTDVGLFHSCVSVHVHVHVHACLYLDTRYFI